jgi:2,3-bisphosphoglycerate-independent phosphoglycerate mutase
MITRSRKEVFCVMSSLKYRPTMLIIMDGCGVSDATFGNAVSQAHTPALDALFAEHPHTLINASGLAVGLPDGQMGNSEVGHLNIGAGRTVYQSLTRITKSIKDGDFFGNSEFVAAMDRAKETGKALHLMGLIGPGGVHSHEDHLVALLEMAKQRGLSEVYVHAWLDGRDTPPRSAQGFLLQLEASIQNAGIGRIATIAGRYYAMDRDNRWERVEEAYDAITLSAALHEQNSAAAIKSAYERDENDEFVRPTNIHPLGSDPVTICSGDSVIFFNFRPDRARELTRAFTEPDFSYDEDESGKVTGFDRKVTPKELYFVTMTEYDASLKHVHIAFPPETIENTLGEYLSSLGLMQLRIAETEKYAHVTFFFNGGEEEPGRGEDRILIPSPKVATYDLKPEMSAHAVANSVIGQIEAAKYDVIILNFANMDMVGHTGIIEAAVKAVEAVDENVGRIVTAVKKSGGQLLITADHGNSEMMLTEDGKPITAHSTNPVPLIFVRSDDSEWTFSAGGALSDIAPTLLSMMDIAAPQEMTGTNLLRRK